MESGVQEETGAISIRNNEPPHPPSLLATRRLPNQVTGGTSAPSPLMIKQMEDEGTSSAARNCVAGFQGVPSSSRLPQNFLPEEGIISLALLLFLKELCIIEIPF